MNDRANLIEHIDTSINDCGTADGLADIAYLLLKEAEYLKTDNNVWNAYYSLRAAIMHYAPISCYDTELIDEVIRNRDDISDPSYY